MTLKNKKLLLIKRIYFKRNKSIIITEVNDVKKKKCKK